MQGGPEVGLAGQTFTVGPNRLAFGVIDAQGKFVYGKSAVYIAPSPDARARGPYPAPADVLVTDPPYRSRQAASETDLFAAVYGAQVRFPKPGHLVGADRHAVRRRDARRAHAGQGRHEPTRTRSPTVGEAAPKVADGHGRLGQGRRGVDRHPDPDRAELHKESFADVVGKKPVALLFATPQLCQSRVCGPVTDIALQMKAKYGDRMTFIHQEVYADNDPNKGLRKPLQEFGLRSEPWLFVVGADGKVTSRLEGSFGLKAFEKAIKTGL